MKYRIIHSKYIKIFLLSLGFLSISTQVILLKEFLYVFYGNELIIGIFLALWMIFTGIGALLKKYILIFNPIQIIGVLNLFLSFLPVILLMSLIWLRNYFVPPGAIPDFLHVILISAIVLFPYCIISGFLFVSYSQLFSLSEKSNRVSSAYAFESIGGIIGGLIVSIVFVRFGMPFQHLLLLVLIHNLLTIFIAAKNKLAILHGSGFLVLISIVMLLFLVNLDDQYMKEIYPEQKIIETNISSYGKIVVTDYNGQINYYNNNQLFYTDFDVIKNEESVHYAMLQHKNPKSILVVSGGLLGQINEIEKYTIEKIDYVEINPAIINLINKDSLNNYDNLQIINSDARKYISETKNKYDIILFNLPPPLTAEINRFYTIEFFKLVNKILNDSAIVSFALPSEPNYISDENAEIHEILFNTLKKVYDNVCIIPGELNYFIASNQSVNINIAEIYSSHYVENQYVNNLFLDDWMIKDRQILIYEAFPGKMQINSDIHPYTYMMQIKFWLKSLFKLEFDLKYILFGLGAIFLLLMIFYKPQSSAMMTSAFTVSFVEISVIMIYQILFGNIYLMIGLIFALFMTGLTFGAYLGEKKKQVNGFKSLINTQLLMLLFSGIVISAYMFIFKIDNNLLVNILLLVLVFVSAFISSVQFAVISRIERKNLQINASDTYGADMIGGAFGAIAVTLILIPLFGFIISSIIICAVNILCIINSFVRRKKILNYS